jgi:glycosyltransferase involved in cell wall biosynthesis
VAKPGVLVIHNPYLQPGGEDAVVRAEVELLRRNGHRVVQYSRHNREIEHFGLARKALLGISTSWDPQSYSQLRSLIRLEKPAIAHCHNLLPLLSPSVYYACRAEKVPVVQTVHNFRMFCSGGNFFRGGSICEECRGGLSRALWHGCYRDSRVQTTAAALMLASHRALGTWNTRIDSYIVPSEFCRRVLVERGIPAQKVSYKPHFVLPTPRRENPVGEYAIFVGRLAPEKGLLPLLRTWVRLRNIPLLVVGGGPLEFEARSMVEAAQAVHISFAGQLSPIETISRVLRARFLVVPSRWYETFGMVVLEAAACGVPAVASRLGALPELVSEGRTGLLFDVDDPDQLADKVRWAWEHPLEMREMGRAARDRCIEEYSPEENYQQLLRIYERALGNASGLTVPCHHEAASAAFHTRDSTPWKCNNAVFQGSLGHANTNTQEAISMKSQIRVLVTGAGGFIGHHLVNRLKAEGYWVRGADIKEPEFEPTIADEFELLDLRQWPNCLQATRGIDWVFNLAADMGGIGYITASLADIARNNILINAHMLEAARINGVRRFLFSSSACVYAGYKQHDENVIPLREEDAHPADPEAGYGWEKLFSEQLCKYYFHDFRMETRIVRFHNVYGPLGTYEGGKEKAPAAVSRKVALTPEGGAKLRSGAMESKLAALCISTIALRVCCGSWAVHIASR